MNTTLNVATQYNCDQLSFYEEYIDTNNPIWRQTVTGCNILGILQDMYRFNVSFVDDEIEKNVLVVGGSGHLLYQQNKSVDLYLRPMSIGNKQLDHMSPVYAADTWSFGFILRRRDYNRYITFFSNPFTRPAWNCLYGMALFVSILFYILKRCEMVTIGGHECCYTNEILMVIGAYCQHIPPIEAKALSRRMAYFVFFMFAYVVYTYYTSNLLSHLVNDKQHTLTDLPKIDIEIGIVDYMHFTGPDNTTTFKRNYSSILTKIKPVSTEEGLEGVKFGKMALLSDFTSLYPMIKKSFTDEEICEISTINVLSNIRKYIYSSKQFKYKEQFKIGTLRAKESGIMDRLMSTVYDRPKCEASHLVQIMFIQISIPIAILCTTYLISICIMLLEKLHYERNKVWPYVN